jgi:hypothetical protein
MSARQNISEAVRGMRCTQATLYAFGIDECPKTGIGVLEAINKAYNYAFIDEVMGMKVGDFIREYSHKGNYVISTANHSMALVNGTLIDTAHGTNRRKICYVFEVIK